MRVWMSVQMTFAKLEVHCGPRFIYYVIKIIIYKNTNLLKLMNNTNC